MSMPTTPTAIIGENVRAEMARRGVTQMMLAHEIGLSQAAVSARLKGKTPFDINRLVRIAHVLDVDLGVLLAGVETSAA